MKQRVKRFVLTGATALAVGSGAAGTPAGATKTSNHTLRDSLRYTKKDE